MTINLHQSHVNKDNFIHTLDSAIRTLQSERRIGRIVGEKIIHGLTELKIPENLVVIGDLHGDLRSLLKILAEINFETFLANEHNKIIFLGDYIDRGNESIEVLYTICFLKTKYPNSVILMRGNHESPIEFPFESHDLPLKIREYFGSSQTGMIYHKILSMFHLLTLVTIVGNILFLTHGGLPINLQKNFRVLIHAAQNHKNYSALEEFLWNDPRSEIKDARDWEISRRIRGKHFGETITKRWLELSKTKVVLRGHEPCMGYKIDHDGKLITIFSCKSAYPKFEASYLSISKNDLMKINTAYDLAKYVKKI